MFPETEVFLLCSTVEREGGVYRDEPFAARLNALMDDASARFGNLTSAIFCTYGVKE